MPGHSGVTKDDRIGPERPRLPTAFVSTIEGIAAAPLYYRRGGY